MEEEKKTPEVADDLNAKNSEETKYNELHGEVLGERVKVLSPARTVAKRFFRSKLSVVGLVIIIALFLISFIGPLFSSVSPAIWGETEIDKTPTIVVNYSPTTYLDANKDEASCFDISVTQSDINKESELSANHWLGTDESGYDIFSRLLYGGRISLTIGFVVVILETLIGVILGGIAGYFGGKVDNLIMRITDVLYCIPTLPIMLIFYAVFNNNNILGIERLYYMMGVLTLIGWAGTARLVRGQILSLREQEFMLAAKCSGLSAKRKIFKHLIPNVLPQLIVSMTLGLGSIILTEATLGFLGIGAPEGTATWGAMINSAANSIRLSYYPNFWIPPGICITLAILAFNFVGDGLRDAFDPKMKR